MASVLRLQENGATQRSQGMANEQPANEQLASWLTMKLLRLQDRLQDVHVAKHPQHLPAVQRLLICQLDWRDMLLRRSRQSPENHCLPSSSQMWPLLPAAAVRRPHRQMRWTLLMA
jgi:hypothetical protein